MSYNTNLQGKNQKLQEILETINNLPDAGGEQVTPEITVDSKGLITATAGAKSATKQLAFQAAKTITPSTTSQIAVSSGYYTGGNVTVAGDSNLVAGNIKSGTSIFGVTGTYEGNGGNSGEAAEWSEAEDAIVTGTLSVYTNDRVTNIGSYAFCNCTKLTDISFPNCSYIGNYAFTYCSSLTNVSFPNCSYIGNSVFDGCTSLTSISFPNCRYIGNSVFDGCTSLTNISFPNCSYIGSSAFYNCSSLTDISFPICSYIDSNAFYNCKSLTDISFPNCSYIGNYAFTYCSSLTNVSFPNCSYIGTRAFTYCYNLTDISFPNCSYIGSSAFYRCYNLKEFYLMNSSVCTLSNSNAFTSTPIGGYSKSAGTYGSIYVPMSLLASYQAATNWTYFSSRFVGVE